MTQSDVEASKQSRSSFYIAYQLPEIDSLQQAYVASPNHYDIFLAYTPESVPLAFGLSKIISEEGFTPCQGDLKALMNSSPGKEHYQEIFESDAFTLVLGKTFEVPLSLQDELAQALDLNKLIYIVAQQPLNVDAIKILGLNGLKWLQVSVNGDSIFEELARILVNSLTYARLSVRAKEWQECDRELSYLLSHGDINASLKRVEWLNKHPNLSLKLTSLQEEFLEASRQQDKRLKAGYLQEQAPDVFISYCSKDRKWVETLDHALEQKGFEVWIDWENIPVATNWRQEAQEGILAAHTFIFVITEESLMSGPCEWEVQEALKHNRRIITICIAQEFSRENLKRIGLSEYTYIRFYNQTFEEASDQLEQAIRKDLRDIKEHRRLHNLALDWLNHSQQSQLLLGRAQYKHFRTWQKERSTKSGDSVRCLHPLKDTQLQYLDASGKAIRESNTKVLGCIASGFVLALSAGFFSEFKQIQILVESLKDKPGLEGVITALEAAKQLDSNRLLMYLNPDLRVNTTTALHKETLAVRELNRLQGHERTIYGIAFSPNADHIISTGEDTTVQVWNFSSSLGKPLENHENEVLAVEYSSDGDFFVSSDADGAVNLWSCRSEILSRYRRDAQVGADDSSQGEASNSCQWIKTLPDGPTERVLRLSISPGSQYIAASSFDGNVYRWKRSPDPEFFRPIDKISHGNNSVFGLDFNPRERVLVSADTSGQVKVSSLDGISEEPLSILIDRWVFDTRFSHDGKLVAIGGADGLLKIWDRETGKVVDLPGHKEGFVHVLFHPFERRLVSADTAGVINLWQPSVLDKALNKDESDSEALKPSLMLGHQGAITRIRFNSDGSYLASASIDDTIRLWLSEDGTLLDVMSGHRDEVLNLAFSPKRGGQYGENYLASSSRDGTVRLWQINNDVRSLKHDNRLYDVAFHPSGRVLASSGRGSVSLWRLQDYKLLGKVNVNERPNQPDIFSVHYSPDGTLLAAGDAKGNITLWDHPVEQYQTTNSDLATENRRLYKQQWLNVDKASKENASTSEVSVVRFHPDIQIIAAGSDDGVVRFWSFQGELLGEQAIGREGYAVTSLDFSQNGKFLVVSTRPKLERETLTQSSYSEGGQIEVYEVKADPQLSKVSLEPLHKVTESANNAHSEGILTVTFNPVNPNEFASGGKDGDIKIWDRSGRFIKILYRNESDSVDARATTSTSRRERNRVTRVDYSNDGKMLVSSSEDGTVTFWNVRTGKMISSLKRHERQVAKAIFNPVEPTMVASAGFDAQVLIWKIPEEFQENSLQKLVLRGCLLADEYLALGDKTVFRPLREGEREVRHYCRRKPAVMNSLRENENEKLSDFRKDGNQRDH